MTYDYDRAKTAATMDVHAKWRAIVDKHAEAERREMQALLKDMVKYLKSNGLDLDINRSYLSKVEHGSDGMRLSGELIVSERAENVLKIERPDMLAKWVAEATELHGGARKIGEGPAKRQADDLPVGVWAVDVSQY